MGKNIFVFILLFFPIAGFCQILTPVKWSFHAAKLNDKEYELVFESKIDAGWHIYSQHLPEGDGPIPASFHFDKNAGFKLTGEVEEGKPISHFDPAFEKILNYFEVTAVFRQKIEAVAPLPVTVKGYLEFMSCDNERCLPPEEVPFTFEITGKEITFSRDSTLIVSDTSDASAFTITAPNDSLRIKANEETGQSNADMSLWAIFLAGILGGLLGLITPCVFPMIPITVSFFLKRSEKRTKGIRDASFYSLSIAVIYVLVGFLVSKIFGSDALREMTSNAVFNIAVFLLFILFGISFLGAFEIQLPSSWANKTDAASEKSGMFGIFFMALTLVLVSFSCTGPIIGVLLVQSALGGNNLGPLAGMTGFAIALALPFGLFAAFPGWMNSLPKSGGWLNAVKVTLGIITLAFSLKFLSNADLAYHWGIISREMFLAIWIVLFTVLGFYLLGKIKFSHDSDVPFVSTPRLLFAITSFAFAVYMVPGLWGAPLHAISAFTPPFAVQEFDLSRGINSTGSSAGNNKKYGNLFRCPHDINCFFDYKEGIEHARQAGKPLLIDFTGWSCVNCKKMEATVWSDPRVLKRLKEDFVLVSLYIDDKTELPENEQFTSSFSGKKIRTVGQKWSDFQSSHFGANSQPFYIPLGLDEKPLISPAGYTSSADKYLAFLDEALNKFHK